jgi:hypothetical protein
LDNLVAKGVKVDLGIPKELWHKPSAEVTNLKTQCETLLENHEEDIEKWYFDYQEKFKLQDFLCKQRMLKGKSQKCLTEPMDKIKESKKTLKKKGEHDEL